LRDAREPGLRENAPVTASPVRVRRAGLPVSALVAAAVLGPAAADAGRSARPAARGKVLFVAACGSCHTLRAAGTRGRVGPDLDREPASYPDLVEQITRGGEGMPALASLGPAAIRAIAGYVSTASRVLRGVSED
jgi:mono/diheme cytochrome c family protein